MEISLQGVERFVAAVEHQVTATVAATRQAVATAAHAVEDEIKRQLTTSSHRRGTPTPSAPGEPPSLVTGNLRRSIRVQGPTAGGAMRWEASVGPTAIYGRIQELGGVAGRGARLPARPYVAPGLRAARGRIETAFRQAWARG